MVDEVRFNNTKERTLIHTDKLYSLQWDGLLGHIPTPYHLYVIFVFFVLVLANAG